MFFKYMRKKLLIIISKINELCNKKFSIKIKKNLKK